MAHHWLDTEEYPFAPHFFEVEGHRMHYVDEGAGDVLLFVHGTPSWSFDFRKVIKVLSRHYRCIAIDHIGFGLSDKPEKYDYSTLHHSRVLEKFIVARQLTDLTLVVHDFGGPIGLHFAIHSPNTVKRLIILNSWLWSSKDDPDFVRVSRVLRSPILPFLYRYLNFSPRFILPNSFGDTKLSKRMQKQYTAPFVDSTQRNGALAFAKSLLNDQDWFEELWQLRSSISGKPTLFIWGMKDLIIKPKHLEKFQSGFTNSRTVALDTCGHFPQEERWEEVVSAMLTFLAS